MFDDLIDSVSDSYDKLRPSLPAILLAIVFKNAQQKKIDALEARLRKLEGPAPPKPRPTVAKCYVSKRELAKAVALKRQQQEQRKIHRAFGNA